MTQHCDRLTGLAARMERAADALAKGSLSADAFTETLGSIERAARSVGKEPTASRYGAQRLADRAHDVRRMVASAGPVAPPPLLRLIQRETAEIQEGARQLAQDLARACAPAPAIGLGRSVPPPPPPDVARIVQEVNRNRDQALRRGLSSFQKQRDMWKRRLLGLDRETPTGAACKGPSARKGRVSR